MQVIQNNSINPCLSDLLITKKIAQKEGKLELFIKENPEILGLREEKGSIFFDTYQLKIDLRDFSIEEKKEIIRSTIKNKPFDTSLKIIEFLLENRMFDLIEETLSNFSHKEELVKQVNTKEINLLKCKASEVISMIITFPKINWIYNLWKEDWHTGVTNLVALEEYNPSRDQLLIYSKTKGTNTDRGAEIFSHLLEQAYEGMNRTIFSRLNDEIKKIIIKELFLSQYPILASAPEIFQESTLYSKKLQYELDKKITRLAFREYRHNNGLCENTYTRKQINDITEMFCECLSKNPISFKASVWRKFIDIIGKDQEAKKPCLKKGMIERAIISAWNESR